jgi:hypothetical protein
MAVYRPRRAGSRWLEGAPAYIFDVFDDKGVGDRYTVFFGADFIYHVAKDGKIGQGSDQYANTYLAYLGMSGAPSHPQGISQWGELEAYQTAMYRYRNKNRRIRWLDLPEHIRNHVIARATDSNS